MEPKKNETETETEERSLRRKRIIAWSVARDRNFTTYMHEDDRMIEDSVTMEPDAEVNNEEVESSFGREPCHGVEDAEMTVISDEREPILYELDGSIEPYIGMKFESEEAAMKYYDAYSKRVGFIIRVSYCQRSKCDKSVVSRTFVCNKEGFRQDDYRRRPIVRYPRPPTRVGCKAMLVVRKEKPGIWVVTKLETKHSHPLGIPSGKGRKGTVQPRQVQPRDEKDKRIRELSLELHRSKQREDEYKERLDKLLKDIARHTNNITKSVQDVVNNVKEIESKGGKDH
ncbi:hypothetical protein HHK36_022046 [Tetracentron sinense]|uniref:FAR1 domain-containing protein n=1 Tax=Tetracentron sinense TaxID=13715 RepID=A0A834YP03_TETSI|nr:hypothetical protein HHK36_022046 [Tetracentron sinense]